MSPMGPPDPSIVSAALDDSMSNTPWLAKDARRLNGPVNRQIEMGIDYDDHRGAMRITGGRTSPLNAIPDSHNDREHYEVIQYFDEASDEFLVRNDTWADDQPLPTRGTATDSGGYRDDMQGFEHPHNQIPLGMNYHNYAQNPMPYAAQYANMTEVPTSTTNPLRPRTIAAGYDAEGGVLTVMFRDGTLYNYYEVTATQWYNFRRARSKGRFIYTYLDQKPRGIAETGNLTPGAAEAFARIARTAQHFKGGLNDNHSASSKRGGKGSYRKGNLGGSTRSKQTKFKNL